VTGPLLEARDVTIRFGGLVAVKDANLTLKKGEILGLIGPNGAGKTTLFNALSGFVTPASGTIRLYGEVVNGLPPYELARRGVGRTFQVERPFEELTVLENVMVSTFLHHRRTADARAAARKVLVRAGLADRADQRCRELNLARRRRLEVARALATEPRVLFLDEAIAGLNPPAQAEMIEFVRSLAEDGLGIVMVEHIMRVILSLTHHVICLAAGEKIAEGTPQEVVATPAVIDAYLGGAVDE